MTMVLFARIALFFYTGLLITLCLINLDAGGLKPVMAFDKLLHVGAYFTFGFIAILGSRTQRQQLTMLTIGFALGIALEVAQTTLTSYRGGDLADQIANTLGLMLSYTCSKISSVRKLLHLK